MQKSSFYKENILVYNSYIKKEKLLKIKWAQCPF